MCTNFRFSISALFLTFSAAFGAPFAQQMRTFYTVSNGLPDNHVSAVAVSGGSVYAATPKGLAVFANGAWKTVASGSIEAVADGLYVSGGKLYSLDGKLIGDAVESVHGVARGPVLATADAVFVRAGARFVPDAAFTRVAGAQPMIRRIAAGPNGTLAVAAMTGLFERDAKGAWQRLLPRQGARSWAPWDVRAVAYDSAGRLHFASVQGAGVRDGDWKLFTPEDGLPYDDFTSVAAAADGSVWYGTRIGAIRRTGAEWEYRQGLRWLPNDAVHGVAVSDEGAWFATPSGVGLIAAKPLTLAEKAKFFEDEIDKRHRRTEHEYVLGVYVSKPGDPSEFRQVDSDNDGLWTAMYGAGECFACAATKSEDACRRAAKAFEALRFLGTVTQGGSHPAPRGFVARTILPASVGNPNATQYTPERDRRQRETRDGLWKIMDPRWPLSADGKWYWKSDTSSDELDGHYFLYGLYYDLAARTDEQRRRVREHVAALTDHLVEHNFQLVDHDGLVTRWGVFNPEKLNRDPLFWEERSLNSISILSYLKTAEHITGDAKYARAARELMEKHNYDMNTLIAKSHAGAGAGNQSDDEMAFMCMYNLMKYETDPRLRELYGMALRRRWEMEEQELNPLFHYIAAVALKDVVFDEPPARIPLAVSGPWKEESAETLRRYPLDRFNWGLKNSHRKDIVRLPQFSRGGDERLRGYRRNGRVLPIDERYVNQWNHDPWQLNSGGDGRHLADGASFLLPYYMGVYYGFVE